MSSSADWLVEVGPDRPEEEPTGSPAQFSLDQFFELNGGRLNDDLDQLEGSSGDQFRNLIQPVLTGGERLWDMIQPALTGGEQSLIFSTINTPEDEIPPVTTELDTTPDVQTSDVSNNEVMELLGQESPNLSPNNPIEQSNEWTTVTKRSGYHSDPGRNKPEHDKIKDKFGKALYFPEWVVNRTSSVLFLPWMIPPSDKDLMDLEPECYDLDNIIQVAAITMGIDSNDDSKPERKSWKSKKKKKKDDHSSVIRKLARAGKNKN